MLWINDLIKKSWSSQRPAPLRPNWTVILAVLFCAAFWVAVALIV
jgi:hypothetical protein